MTLFNNYSPLHHPSGIVESIMHCDGARVTRRRRIVNQRRSYRFGVTWGWVCGWTDTLSNITQATVSFLNMMLILYNSSTSWMCYILDNVFFFLISQRNSSRQSQNRAFVHLRAALLCYVPKSICFWTVSYSVIIHRMSWMSDSMNSSFRQGLAATYWWF